MITLEEVFTYEHLYICANECCKGVRWKASTQQFESAMLMNVSRLKRQVLSGTFRSKGFHDFTIHERGKVRHIQSVHISERVVQKCLVKYCLRPLVTPKLIYSTHATLPGHGTDTALKEVKEHLRWWHARHGMDGGVLVMDYHDHFGSIRHDKLKEMYRRLDMDDRLYALTCYFIDCFDGEVGVGLGSEVSQISAVFYVSGIDHFVKDAMGVHCYTRYMDDSLVVGEIEDLEIILGCIEALSSELGLGLNTKVTMITPLGDGFRFLKKRIHLSDTGRVVMRLLRSNITRERRRLKDNIAKLAQGRITPETEYQSWQSWRSYAMKVDGYDTAKMMEALRVRLLAG